MGGIAKHLSHVWEDLDMTFGDLKEIISESSLGNLDAVEKWDGVNLHFCVDSSGMVRFGRNDTHRREGGLNLRELRDFFEGHPAQDTFVRGGIAICEMMQNEWWPLGFSKRNWVNCDVIDIQRPQLLNYDRNAITLHEAVSYDASGVKLSATSESVKNQFKRLVESLPSSVSFDGEEFDVFGPHPVAINQISGTDDYYQVIEAINHCQKSTAMNDEGTLREFAYRSIYAGVTSQINISESKAKELTNLIVGYESPTLVQLKKGLPSGIASRISAVGKSTVRGKVVAEAMLPIETALSTLGSYLLDGVSSALIQNPAGECERIKAEYISARTVCESIDDGFQARRIEAIEKHVRKIELNNYRVEESSFIGFAIEGVVFERNNKKYKLTGNFAPVNQIVGTTRYGRGKIPAVNASTDNKNYSILEGFSVG